VIDKWDGIGIVAVLCIFEGVRQVASLGLALIVVGLVLLGLYVTREIAVARAKRPRTVVRTEEVES
jgi:hypothetical protein